MSYFILRASVIIVSMLLFFNPSVKWYIGSILSFSTLNLISLATKEFFRGLYLPIKTTSLLTGKFFFKNALLKIVTLNVLLLLEAIKEIREIFDEENQNFQMYVLGSENSKMANEIEGFLDVSIKNDRISFLKNKIEEEENV